jgi:hypothetical protein
LSKENDYFSELRKEYDLDKQFWSEPYDAFRRDMRMRTGDQWDHDVKEARENDPYPRPALTFNTLHTQVQLMANQVRQNPVSPKVEAGDDEASEDTAQALEDALRQINHESNGDAAREMAINYAGSGGFGFYTHIQEYADDATFELKLGVERILDPTTVICDRFVEQPDFSDATRCVIAKRLSWPAYKRKFGGSSKVTDVKSFKDFDSGNANLNDWADDESIQVGRHLWIEFKTRRFVRLKDKTEGYAEELDFDEKEVDRERDEEDRIVHDDIINGVEKLRETIWLGNYIPVYPVLGEELVVDGQRQLISLIRYAHDAARLKNAYHSGIAEAIGLTTNRFYMGVTGQFKDKSWNYKTKKNSQYREYSVVLLPDGSVAPPPVLQTGEAAIQALGQAALQMEDQIRASTGYVDNVIQPSRGDLSGVAVQKRSEQSNMVNSHFSDNLMTRTILHEGKCAVEWIKRAWDVPKGRRTRSLDGKSKIQYFMAQGQMVPGKEDQPHHDLTKGRFSVTVTSGPSYANKLEANSDALGQTLQADPALFMGYADLYFKMRGLPELEARAKLLAPPPVQAALQQQDGKVNPQQLMAQGAQLQAENQQLKAGLQQLLQEKQAKLMELKSKMMISQSEQQNRKDIALINASAGITEAEVKAGNAAALALIDSEMASLSQSLDNLHDLSMTGLDQAHERGLQQQQMDQQAQQAEQDRQHQQGMQDSSQAAASDSQTAAQAHQTQMAESAQEAAAAANTQAGD